MDTVSMSGNGPPKDFDPRRRVVLSGGQTLYNVHLRSACSGQTCCIHNSSPHSLWEAPQIWDNDTKSMFRQCAHHVLHPDMDDLAHKLRTGGMLALLAFGVHECDGCCVTDIPPAAPELKAITS
jgi:hypothetical protein